MIEEPRDLLRDLEMLAFDIESRYNIAPSQPTVVAFQESDSRPEMQPMIWGLAKDRERPRVINIKAESVAHKPSLRAAFKHRRCLIPASGFYQWTRRRSGQTVPYYFRPSRPDEPMAFAGLWDVRRDGGDGVYSFAVITTAAVDSVAPVHERMPVTIPRIHWRKWLNPNGHDYFGLLTMLLPTMSIGLYSWKVGAHVNDASVDCEQCIVRVA